MSEIKTTAEVGPIYGQKLIDRLPIGNGLMLQAMPSRSDLLEVAAVNGRVAAAYEVLLNHFLIDHQKLESARQLIDELIEEVDCWAPHAGDFLLEKHQYTETRASNIAKRKELFGDPEEA